MIFRTTIAHIDNCKAGPFYNDIPVLYLAVKVDNGTEYYTNLNVFLDGIPCRVFSGLCNNMSELEDKYVTWLKANYPKDNGDYSTYAFINFHVPVINSCKMLTKEEE